MKIDKETIVVFIIATALIFGWQYAYPKYFAPPPQKVQAESDAVKDAKPQDKPVEKAQAEKPPEEVMPDESKNDKPAESKDGKPAAELPSESIPDSVSVPPSFTLSNNLASFKIDPASGGVEMVELKKFKTFDKKHDVSIGVGVQPKALSIGGFDGWNTDSISLSKSDGSLSASLTRGLSKGDARLRLIQSFELGDSYSLNMLCRIENLGTEPLKLDSLSVWAGGLPPLQYLSGDKLFNDPHNIDSYSRNGGNVISKSPSDKDDADFKKGQTDNPLEWIGVSNKYFATVLVPSDFFNGGSAFTRRELDSLGEKKESYFLPSVAGVYRTFDINPSDAKEMSFTYYAGPKSMGDLKSLPAKSIMSILHLSYYSWFEFIARPLLQLLNWLDFYCGSYGLAIILLTVIVRLAFWPATQKANSSMRKMQRLQPLVKELKEKYKDDSQTMNMKMMELYKKERVNPLGGCLPILLQLPVFFALYSTLDAAVELRQVPFLWAHDLSRPDLVGPQFFFGYGIHPLIIMMTALMVVQQKLTPSMGDPMQQKIMMFMPLIMLFMLYNLPSGLTLYWTVSQVFSILQLKYSQYVAKREEQKEALSKQTA